MSLLNPRGNPPAGWPSAAKVAQMACGAMTADGPTLRVVPGSERVLSIRSWSVVYVAEIDESGTGPASVVIKCPREPHHDGIGQGSDDGARSRLEYDSLTVARQAGLPVPDPLAHLPEIDGVVMRLVNGRPLSSLRLPGCLEGLEKLGRTVRRLSSLETDFVPRSIVPAGERARSIASMMSRLESLEIMSFDSRRWDSVLAGAVSVTRSCDTVCWTHADLNPGNVLVRPDGTISVLDLAFEKQRHPLDDVAKVAAFLRTQMSRAATRGRYRSPQQVEARIERLLAGFGPHESQILAVHELYHLIRRWLEVHEKAAERRAGARERMRVMLLSDFDRQMRRELENWHHRHRTEG